MAHRARFLAFALALPLANGHFVLNTPAGIGFNEDLLTQGPCGSFDVNNRTTVTDWPVNGSPIGLLNADDELNATVRFALATNTAVFTAGTRFNMVGKGNLCLPSVPAPDTTSNLVGLQGVVQVVGTTSDGQLFQCAAIRFTAPVSAPAVPVSCTNSTGIKVVLA